MDRTFVHGSARGTPWVIGMLVLAACGSGDSAGSGGSTSSSSSSGGAGSGSATGSGSGGASASSSGGGSSGVGDDTGMGSSGGAGGDASGGAGDDASTGSSSSGVDGGGASEAGASHDGGSGGGTSTPPKGGCKRGIAANTAPSMALAPSASNPGVSWWYNWAVSGSGQASGIEFDPMMWGSSSLNSALPKGSKYVLGFNEPNFSAQSDLTPQQAASDWPKVEAAAKATGAAIVSPAVNFCGGCTTSGLTSPYDWLKQFFAACTGCTVDYVAVHWYNCDLPSLQGYIEGNSSLAGFVQFGKPIWLTEFSCSGSSTAADNKTYMQAAVPWLESNAHVYRYSWFSASPIANAELVNSDGSLTDLGKTYVSLPEPSCQ